MRSKKENVRDSIYMHAVARAIRSKDPESTTKDQEAIEEKYLDMAEACVVALFEVNASVLDGRAKEVKANIVRIFKIKGRS